MKLTHLSDLDLVEKAKALTAEERRVTAEILHYLKEIDIRKLYAEYGCDSLHAFCIKVLRYSEGQAHRRITAARMIGQMPVVEEKLKSGELSLSNVVQAQAFFNEEKRQGRELANEQKAQVLERLESLSAKQGEQVLAAISPERKTVSESIWALDTERYGFRMEMSRDLKAKLDRMKCLMRDCATYSDVIEKMTELTLHAIDPLRKAERAAERATKSGVALKARADVVTESPSFKRQGVRTGRPGSKPNAPHEVSARATHAPQSAHAYQAVHASPASQAKGAVASSGTRPRPSIPAAVRHFVWIRDQGRCSWHHPQTGERCMATRYLELDHSIPYAQGGADDADNLRLTCRAHNVRHGIKCFGVARMNAYGGSVDSCGPVRRSGRGVRSRQQGYDLEHDQALFGLARSWGTFNVDGIGASRTMHEHPQ